MNVLLFCLTVIVTLTVIRGWSRGLIGLIFGLASWAFVIAAVVFGSPVVYNYLTENTAAYDVVYEKVLESARSFLPSAAGTTGKNTAESADGKTAESGEMETQTTDSLTADTALLEEESSGEDPNSDEGGTEDASAEDKTRDVQTDLAAVLEDSDLAIDEDTVRDIIQNKDLSDIEPAIENLTKSAAGGVTGSVDLVREKVSEKIAAAIAERILRIIAGVFCYLAANIICIIVKILLHAVTSPKPIGFILHLAGALVGAAEGYIYTMIILLIISQIRFVDVGMRLYEQVESSSILTMLYTANPLLSFFENFF